ncbi:MAG: hypothetical protein C5B59_02495 [Bacteroidetes bacterium]|nr:MAG: hypothetical protein C5B59_02495 [Bacteroidota bacterium]
MKNIINYYAAIVLPFIGIILLLLNGFGGWFFLILFLIYFLVYRPLMSGYRLVALGVIKKSQIWRNWIPGWNFRHFTLLWFNKP